MRGRGTRQGAERTGDQGAAPPGGRRVVSLDQAARMCAVLVMQASAMQVLRARHPPCMESSPCAAPCPAQGAARGARRARGCAPRGAQVAGPAAEQPGGARGGRGAQGGGVRARLGRPVRMPMGWRVALGAAREAGCAGWLACGERPRGRPGGCARRPPRRRRRVCHSRRSWPRATASCGRWRRPTRALTTHCRCGEGGGWAMQTGGAQPAACRRHVPLPRSAGGRRACGAEGCPLAGGWAGACPGAAAWVRHRTHAAAAPHLLPPAVDTPPHAGRAAGGRATHGRRRGRREVWKRRRRAP